MSNLSPILAFGSLGTGDIILVMFICLLFFGSKKLPDLAKAFGQSVREFKKAASDVEDNFHSAVKEEDRKKAAATSVAPTPTLPAPAPTPPSQSQPAEKL